MRFINFVVIFQFEKSWRRDIGEDSGNDYDTMRFFAR